jgi:hypothetical protein
MALHIINLNLDAHDRTYLRAICTVRYERPYGRGVEVLREKNAISARQLLGRLVCHLERFHAELLPQLEPPPVVGQRLPLVIRARDDELITWKGLAAVKAWSVVDLARALIFYHWQLREKFRAACPAIDYAHRIMPGSVDCLSFAPDRLQPWYYHENETLARIDAAATETLNHLAELLREKGLSEDDIADVVGALEHGRQIREEFAWSGEQLSPGQLRQYVYHLEH